MTARWSSRSAAGTSLLRPAGPATGAHYTPRSLAEEVVQHALEPLSTGPGPSRLWTATTWELRPSTEILALRVADIAMGSGAFLVARVPVPRRPHRRGLGRRG